MGAPPSPFYCVKLIHSHVFSPTHTDSYFRRLWLKFLKLEGKGKAIHFVRIIVCPIGWTQRQIKAVHKHNESHSDEPIILASPKKREVIFGENAAAAITTIIGEPIPAKKMTTTQSISADWTINRFFYGEEEEEEEEDSD